MEARITEAVVVGKPTKKNEACAELERQIAAVLEGERSSVSPP